MAEENPNVESDCTEELLDPLPRHKPIDLFYPCIFYFKKSMIDQVMDCMDIDLPLFPHSISHLKTCCYSQLCVDFLSSIRNFVMNEII